MQPVLAEIFYRLVRKEPASSLAELLHTDYETAQEFAKISVSNFTQVTLCFRIKLVAYFSSFGTQSVHTFLGFVNKRLASQQRYRSNVICITQPHLCL